MNNIRCLRLSETNLGFKLISEYTFDERVVYRKEIDDCVFAMVDHIDIILYKTSDDYVESSCLENNNVIMSHIPWYY